MVALLRQRAVGVRRSSATCDGARPPINDVRIEENERRIFGPAARGRARPGHPAGPQAPSRPSSQLDDGLGQLGLPAGEDVVGPPAIVVRCTLGQSPWRAIASEPRSSPRRAPARPPPLGRSRSARSRGRSAAATRRAAPAAPATTTTCGTSTPRRPGGAHRCRGAAHQEDAVAAGVLEVGGEVRVDEARRPPRTAPAAGRQSHPAVRSARSASGFGRAGSLAPRGSWPEQDGKRAAVAAGSPQLWTRGATRNQTAMNTTPGSKCRAMEVRSGCCGMDALGIGGRLIALHSLG